MALSGRLSDYSLAEVFRFVQESRKNGLLSIDRGNGLLASSAYRNYIWFQNGKIVAHSTNLQSCELIELTSRHYYFNEQVTKTLRQESAYMFKPLGTYLESQGLLHSKQLESLFFLQVIQPIVALFAISDGSFDFDDTAPILSSEMTGLSISATELSLQGLRNLHDWKFLEAKLPDPEYGLQRIHSELPAYKLEPKEIEVWNLSKGDTTITQIARLKGLSITETQRIAFRLTAIGLTKEIAIDFFPPVIDSSRVAPASYPPPPAAKSAVSKKFLSNLVGFLKKK
jgi:Domain of unknown function (DUF4388)